MLLREIKNIFHKELDGTYASEEVDSFFYLLIEHYMGLERFILAVRPDLIISKEEETALFAGLSELKLNRPIQYILGKTTFMDLELHVDENVLIPRPETEELVRWIIDECNTGPVEVRHQEARDFRILDIGTGSGCIAIGLAKNLPEAKVFALDISERALKIAERNSVGNEVDITFWNQDIFELETELEFDIIVSNPPYVRELEKKEMAENVLEHEPELALFVADENPLKFYKSIVEFVQSNLSSDGALFLEINQYLGKEMTELLKEHNFKDIELRKDMFGNDRMLKGKISPMKACAEHSRSVD